MELTGHTNAPSNMAMPTLSYKYKMSEPFAGGDKDEFMISHEQNDFKRKFIYQLKDEKIEENEDGEVTSTPLIKETSGRAYEEAMEMEDLRREKADILKRMEQRNKG